MLRSIEPEFFARTQFFPAQRIFREMCELLDFDLRHVDLGLGESANDEDVVWGCQRGACEEEAAIREGLNGISRAGICEGLRSRVFPRKARVGG